MKVGAVFYIIFFFSENRFKLLLKRNPEHAVEMLSKAESFYRNYYDRLEDLTTCNW